MNNIWWKQINKSTQFIDYIINTLISGENIILNMSELFPWRETMCNIVENTLSINDSNRMIKIIKSPNENIGQYLLKNYCDETKRIQYRYGISYEDFLGKMSDIKLSSLYLWVTDIPDNKICEWIEFVSKYYEISKGNYARFILETRSDCKYKICKGLRYADIFDNIQGYDVFTFCALASSYVDIKNYIRPYLAELISNICGKDIELCAKCIENSKQFLTNPIETAIYLSSTEKSKFDIENLCWQSQIKLLFPAIENYRLSLIKKHHNEIINALPIQNVFGETINDPFDIELGLLNYLIHEKRVNLDNYNDFIMFKDARNNLAHIHVLDFEAVDKILSIIA